MVRMVIIIGVRVQGMLGTGKNQSPPAGSAAIRNKRHRKKQRQRRCERSEEEGYILMEYETRLYLRAECCAPNVIEKNVFLAYSSGRTLMWIFRAEEINRPIEHLLRPQNSTFTSKQEQHTRDN